MSTYQTRKAERTARYNAEHGRKLVTCVACNGSGYYDHNDSPPCGSCGGTGKVRETAPYVDPRTPEERALWKREMLQNKPLRRRALRVIKGY